MHATGMLSVEGVTKSYNGQTALRGVDLAVEPGQIVGLLGPNGAGKTTLISIVAGLRRPDAGSVLVGGIDVVRRPDAARLLLGLAPQDLGIYPSLSVRENLVFFGELNGLRRKALAARIDEVATTLGITELLPRIASSMSGGEKRRLHTAMALVHRPKLLLLDEPTTGADVASRAQLLGVVRDLAHEGAAVVYSTHYLPEVEDLGASVVLIDRGKVIASGSIAELVARHSHATIELAFEGPAPALSHPGAGAPEGSIVRVTCDNAPAVAASVLTSLGADAQRLQSVQILNPSLESVYLAVTGRRYDADVDADKTGGDGEGVRDVAVA